MTRQRNTLAEKIEPLYRYIPPALIRKKCFDEIVSVCDWYDFRSTNNVAFETRLADDSPRADFSFGVGNAEIDFLKGGIFVDRRPVPQDKTDVLRRLFGRWRRSFFGGNLDGLWLEFDYRGESRDPVPDIVFHPFGGKARSPGSTRADDFSLIRNIAGYWDPAFMSQEVAGNLEKCLDRLRDGNRVSSIGFPLGRKHEKLRLGIPFANADKLSDYLGKIGLRFRRDAERLVADVSGFCKYLFLHLDISSVIHPRIGIEFRQDDLDVLRVEKQDMWRPILDYLAGKGFCSREKADALRTWTGESREITSALLYGYAVKRLIYEIKLVCSHDADFRFKGYFGFYFFDIAR